MPQLDPAIDQSCIVCTGSVDWDQIQHQVCSTHLGIYRAIAEDKMRRDGMDDTEIQARLPDPQPIEILAGIQTNTNDSLQATASQILDTLREHGFTNDQIQAGIEESREDLPHNLTHFEPAQIDRVREFLVARINGQEAPPPLVEEEESNPWAEETPNPVSDIREVGRLIEPISIEEAGAALNILSERGRRGLEAGRILNQELRNLNRPPVGIVIPPTLSEQDQARLAFCDQHREHSNFFASIAEQLRSTGNLTSRQIAVVDEQHCMTCDR